MEKSKYHKKKEPGLNKQLIIDAAIDIGSSSDWYQVTFQSISDKTGLSKGGIIHHFRNKEELLDELMSQSLVELTSWVKQYKEANDAQDGALAYLEFVLAKNDDEKYHRTMRIVLQAIMINANYRESWLAWYKEYIAPTNGSELSVKSQLTMLAADAIWYSEHMGIKILDHQQKKKLLHYIKLLK